MNRLKKLLLPIILSLFCVPLSFGQITFEKNTTFQQDKFIASTIKQSVDSGFVLVGYKKIANFYVGCLMKTNKYGDTSWVKNYQRNGENQLENNFNIFPNPFTSEAKFVFNVPQTNTEIQLLDVLGNELQTMSFSGTEYTLYRESLSASMYFVQITDASGKVALRKIVME